MKLLLILLLLPLSVSFGQTYNEAYVFADEINRVVLTDAGVKQWARIDSPTLLTVPEGMDVKLVQREGEFYKVFVDSTYGYLHYVFFGEDYKTFSSRNYKLKPVGPPGSSNLDKENSEWYAQVGPFTEVQQNPSPIAATLFTLPVNSIIKVKLHNLEFWQVTMNGKVGYIMAHRIVKISKTLSDLSNPNASPDSGSTPPSSTMYSTPTTGATIHTGPRGGRYYYNSNGNKTYIRRK